MNDSGFNEYNVSNEDILKEFLLKLKYTFSNKLFYVGTTTDKDHDIIRLTRDIDVLLIINGLQESMLTYVWDIISSLYTKYNIVVDTRVYSPEDLKNKATFQQHKRYLLSIFLNDLYGENPFASETVITAETKKSCYDDMKSQIQNIIKLIPRTAVEHSNIKNIARCVFDAFRAFLIIEGKPVASKKGTIDIIETDYKDFKEVVSIYKGYINPAEIINISKFISDSLAVVKHVYYKSLVKKVSKNLLLVNTPSSLFPHPRSDYLSYDQNMPLGLVCLASFLESNQIKCDILDAYAENLGAIGVVDRIFEQDDIPTIIGFNTSSPNIHIVHKIASYIKRIDSDIAIICGGPHASLAKDHTLSEKSIDYIISGEGEQPLLDLTKVILNDNKEGISNIPGVYSLVAHKVIGIKNNEAFKFENLPILNFSKLPIDRYFNVKKRLYVHTTRGCAFNCIYCSVPKVWGSNVREIPMQILFDQIEHGIKNYNAEEIQIVDDNFSHKKGKLIKEFCEIKNSRNLKFSWKCQVRADQIDNDLLELMANSDCFEIDFGIESGNAEIQKYIRKNLDLDKSLLLTEKASELNLFSKAFFMLGFPEENYDQITDTINYAIDLKLKGLKDVAFFPVMPFPGTEISNLTGVTVFQGAKIDNLNFNENTYENKSTGTTW